MVVQQLVQVARGRVPAHVPANGVHDRGQLALIDPQQAAVRAAIDESLVTGRDPLHAMLAATTVDAHGKRKVHHSRRLDQASRLVRPDNAAKGPSIQADSLAVITGQGGDFQDFGHTQGTPRVVR